MAGHVWHLTQLVPTHTITGVRGSSWGSFAMLVVVELVETTRFLECADCQVEFDVCRLDVASVPIAECLDDEDGQRLTHVRLPYP